VAGGHDQNLEIGGAFTLQVTKITVFLFYVLFFIFLYYSIRDDIKRFRGPRNLWC
jgi:hypothetical protein